ncbi:EF2563 family selenium-dependent molybdenum hydroxylase system protein [bacterium]|nr:EF2563 family selenium-dependent molybdenum hydroxylase system protein [bacterium]
MTARHLHQLNILIKGAGEMATGIACRLYRANLRQIVMAETHHPLAVRRAVSFCEAVIEDTCTVEGITATRTTTPEEIVAAWQKATIAVIVDPGWEIRRRIRFDVVIDAILAKKNLGTDRSEAPLVIGMGPGFTAGVDVHRVIETNRGHDLGRVLETGKAAENTGVPGNIEGHTIDRVLRAPCDGPFLTERSIGDPVRAGDAVGAVDSQTVRAEIDGVIRGLIRPGSTVHQGLKIGDIDPRGNRSYCHTISDKARALGGAVLEAVLSEYNV